MSHSTVLKGGFKETWCCTIFFIKFIKSNFFQEYRVPKGWTVIYNIRDTHEFEYEGMEEFNPERFAPKNDTEDKFR